MYDAVRWYYKRTFDYYVSSIKRWIIGSTTPTCYLRFYFTFIFIYPSTCIHFLSFRYIYRLSYPNLQFITECDGCFYMISRQKCAYYPPRGFDLYRLSMRGSNFYVCALQPFFCDRFRWCNRENAYVVSI